MRAVIGPYPTWLPKAKKYRPAKRKLEVKIDPFDTWSMDHTLSFLILPMLKQLKATKNGAPNVDDEDVPKKLQRAPLLKGLKPDDEAFWNTDKHWFKRWDYVLDEMIWAFTQIEADKSGTDFYNRKLKLTDAQRKAKALEFDGRIQNGTKLFGKYYQCLWD